MINLELAKVKDPIWILMILQVQGSIILLIDPIINLHTQSNLGQKIWKEVNLVQGVSLWII